MEMITIIIVALVSLGIGVAIAIIITKSQANNKSKTIIKEARMEADGLKKDKIHDAKEEILNLKGKHDKWSAEKSKEINKTQSRLGQKENTLNQKIEELKKKQRDLSKEGETLINKQSNLEIKEREIAKAHKEQVTQLETIANLTAEEAKEQLIEAIKGEAKSDAINYAAEMLEEAKANANLEAKKIVIETIQRTATEHAIENTVSIFNIENDEIKGRIIGREGRNIRALEAATGIEIIVDDTPEAIILSGFDPVRREIARLSLHKLVTDGRIHPARIEEVVAKTKKMIEQEIIDTGKRTAIDLGIHNMHHEILRMVGRMKYRSSYGQNLLQHSREVANLCATMASELGLNPKLAKRAGLLHDIGKVPDQEAELPHALYGMKIAEKYKEKPEVCNAIGSHHDEIEMTTLLAPIVQVCDAISGARPGARREVAESYINRLKELESHALNFPGVIKTYAIQAGRELRVIVGAEQVSDDDANKISFELSKKIQEEMTYPGQIKITVIRETRAIAYAK